MIPYIKVNRNGIVNEGNCDLVILHDSTPILLSVIDLSNTVKKMFADMIKINSSITLYDRNNIFHENPLRNYDDEFEYKLSKHDHKRTHGIIYNTKQEEYMFDWDGQGLVKTLTTHLKEKNFIPVTEYIVEKVLALAGEDRIVSECKVYTTQDNMLDVSVWHIGNAKAFSHYLSEIDLETDNEFNWNEIEDISDYLVKFADPIKEKLEQNIEILYDENKINEEVYNNTIPFLGQLPIIQGGIEALKQKDNRFLYLAGEQGVGKTICGTKINHIYHLEKDKDSYCTLLVVPAITITQWKEEIVKAIGSDVDIMIIKNTDEFIRFYNQTKMKVTKPTYIIVGKETFKLSYKIRHGVIVKKQKVKHKRKITEGEFKGEIKEVNELIEVCLCSDCGVAQKNPLRKTEDIYFTEKDYLKPKKSNYKCQECDSVLFQAVYDKTKKTSIVDFVKRQGINFDSVIIDEAHQSNNFDSIIGKATRDIMQRAKKVLLLSGTVTNGYASSIYNILFALIPNTLKRDNVFDKDRFIEAYGTLLATSKDNRIKEGDYHITSRTKVKTGSFREIEGINPLVFSKYFVNNFIFSELDEIRDDLLPLIEAYVDVPHLDEVILGENKLIQEIKQASALNASFYNDSVVKHYTNKPFGWRDIPFTYSKDSNRLDTVVSPRNIDVTTLPKEKEVIKICQSEKDLGRKVWVYTDFVTNGKYTEGDSLQERLKLVLEDSGLSVFVLKSTVAPIDRRKIIDQNKDKFDVFISHPQLISVGINLQWCPNYIFFSPSYHVNTTRQAMKRGRRVNSTLQNKVFHMYYDEGIELEIMNRYKLKRIESESIEAKFIQGIDVKRTASSLGAKIEGELSDIF